MQLEFAIEADESRGVVAPREHGAQLHGEQHTESQSGQMTTPERATLAQHVHGAEIWDEDGLLLVVARRG
jgi:hypothetical protein